MRSQIINWIKGFYLPGHQLEDRMYENDVVWWTIGMSFALILASTLVWFISRFILIQVMHLVAGKSKAVWDDHLINNRVFRGLALLVPFMFMDYFLSIAFYHYPTIQSFLVKLNSMLIIFACLVIVNRVFNAIRDILMESDGFRDKPVQSYTQILKIFISGVLIISMFSVLTGKSPLFFLTSLGAISAILLLAL